MKTLLKITCICVLLFLCMFATFNAGYRKGQKIVRHQSAGIWLTNGSYVISANITAVSNYHWGPNGASIAPITRSPSNHDPVARVDTVMNTVTKRGFRDGAAEGLAFTLQWYMDHNRTFEGFPKNATNLLDHIWSNWMSQPNWINQTK